MSSHRTRACTWTIARVMGLAPPPRGDLVSWQVQLKRRRKAHDTPAYGRTRLQVTPRPIDDRQGIVCMLTRMTREEEKEATTTTIGTRRSGGRLF